MSDHSPAMDEALTLLIGAGSWHELRRSMEERGLDRDLSAGEMQELLAAWRQARARRLNDADLARELAFWAEGGGFAAHLEGWRAIPPAALVAEADARGWFVRRLASGAVVNAPNGKPLMLRSLDLMAARPDG